MTSPPSLPVPFPPVPPYVNPYTSEAHRSWAGEGNCPAIHTTRAWCNERAGHKGDHRAPETDSAGRVLLWLYWNDAENHPVGSAPSVEPVEMIEYEGVQYCRERPSCGAEDYPVWPDGSQDRMVCTLTERHDDYHEAEGTGWTWWIDARTGEAPARKSAAPLSADSAPCSTCGGAMTDPPCVRTPETGKGGHTTAGGCAASQTSTGVDALPADRRVDDPAPSREVQP